MEGEEWLFGTDLPETDNRGYGAPLENEMLNFAHSPFVVSSAIKNSIVSSPFLIEVSFIRFLISARSWTVSTQIERVYQLEVVSAEMSNKIRWQKRSKSQR